jgi:dipeptidyl aminopeptidase/acylaminoacyl peptidase
VTRMRPEHIAGLRTVDQPAVSPDGRWVLYVVRRADAAANTYLDELFVVPADGHAPARSLGIGTHPCWAPDGTRVAYFRDATVRVAPFGTSGGERVVAEGVDDAGALSFAPDGRSLAFTARVAPVGYDLPARDRPPRRFTRLQTRLDGVGVVVDRQRHVFVVPVDGSGEVRDVTPGSYEFDYPAWSADSRLIVVTGATHARRDLDLRSDLFVVDVTGGAPPSRWAAGAFAAPSVSPDGGQVAFLGTDDAETMPRNCHVGVLVPGAGPHTWISTAYDRTFAPGTVARPPVWLDDREVLVAMEDRGDVHLYRLGTEPRPVWAGAGTVTAYDAAGGTVAFALSTAQCPSELHVVRAGVTRRATDLGAPVSVGSPRRLSVPSSDGAVELDAWVLVPPGFPAAGSYPVVLNVHGGPFAQYGTGFFEDAQLQAAAGFVAVWCNPRGSSGREEAFGRAIVGPALGGTGWGSVDHDDVIAVLDHVLGAVPALDPDRAGIVGGSYGGYLINRTISRSGRFAAACSERGGSNLATAEWASDAAGTFRRTFGVSHVDDPQLYRAMSPITDVARITTPLLILHAEDDLRTPLGMADELFVALRLLERQVEMVTFPGEGHALPRSGSPLHRRMRAEIVLEFLTRHLRPPAIT